MYLDYWQLDHKPFESVGDAVSAPWSEPQHAALAKLRYAVESGRSAALLAGPAGVGKTLLIDALLGGLDGAHRPRVQVVFPQMTDRDLLHYLADRLGAPPVDAPQGSIAESLNRLEAFFSDNVAGGRHAVLVVDEAHLIEDSRLLEPLRLLLNMRVDRRGAFTMILCGQPELLSVVQRYGALDERVDVKVLLPAFSEEETLQYIERRLDAAGASREIFTPDAVETVHRLAHGVARRINRLCDLALLVGFANSQAVIDAEQIGAVNEELIDVRRAAA